MVRSYLAVGGVALATIPLLALINCGSSAPGTGGSATTSSTSTSTSTSSGAGASTPGVEPPALNTKAPMPDGTGAPTFAIQKLYLGDTDPNGNPDHSNGWKNYGYDLDGQADTATTANHCKPNSGGPKSNFQNGNNGIDNSFGKNILQIILGISSNVSQTINGDIAQGKFTVMFEMEKLGTGTDYQGMTTQLFGGGDLGAAPKWDGTDNWPVLPSLLTDPTDITKGSKVQFPMSYVTSNTWVSGGKGQVTLALSVSGYTLNLNISNAVMSMKLDAGHKTATGGIIAGVLNTEELTTQIQEVAGSFDPSFCDPSNATVQGILTEIKQASDILSDGTQDPTKTCDGISIGLGFDAALIQTPTMIAPASTPKNACADGGAGSSSSSTSSSSTSTSSSSSG